jgi:hypothetical protein
MVYSLESFETFINLIYVFLPIITLHAYIHNLHENLKRTKMTLIILTMPSSLRVQSTRMVFHVWMQHFLRFS